MSLEGPRLERQNVDPYSQIVAKTQRKHRLLSVHWELTYRCNEKCTHCYLDVFAPHADIPGELTTEECFRVIDQIVALGALNLTLSGGEIFVRRDLMEIAGYARSKQLLLRLFTNGILITSKLADRIAALHPYAVEMSLYSVNPEIHDRITQLRHSWELTTRALRLMQERGVRTVMKTPLMHENVHELDDMKSLAQELGAQFHYDITVTPKDTGGLSPLKHRLNHEELVWLFHKEVEPEVWTNRLLAPDQGTCGITLNGLVIDPYGTVSPCVQVRTPAGNVRSQSLQAIWEESPLWQDLHLTLQDLPICSNCELRNICVRCHGLAKVEDGDLMAPALVNCREALARRQVLIEKGALTPDFPIPAHLQEHAGSYLTAPAGGETIRFDNFIPLSELTTLRERPSVPSRL